MSGWTAQLLHAARVWGALSSQLHQNHDSEWRIGQRLSRAQQPRYDGRIALPLLNLQRISLDWQAW